MAKIEHHIWCNDFNPVYDNNLKFIELEYLTSVEECKYCGGENGLIKNYPMENKTEEELMEKHFPKNKIIKRKVSQ